MRARGFTLIELLIVLVLIGVMAGMAILAIGNDGKDRRQAVEAKRLAILLNMAEQESLLRGEAMALELFASGYRFLRLTESGWQAETGDMVFRSRDLPEGIRVSFSIEDNWQALRAGSAVAGPARPQVLLMPDGVAESMEIRFSDGEHSISVTNIDAAGWAVAEAAL